MNARLTRRKALAGLGGLLAGGTTYAVVGVGAVAGVTADALSIEDGTYSDTDAQNLYSPVISVDATWSFSGADRAAQVMLALLFDGGIGTTKTLPTDGTEDGETTPLSAPVVASRNWESAQFKPANGETITRDVATELRLEVRDSQGETLVKDSATQTVPITVEDTGVATTASVGASGSVSFAQTSEE